LADRDVRDPVELPVMPKSVFDEALATAKEEAQDLNLQLFYGFCTCGDRNSGVGINLLGFLAVDLCPECGRTIWMLPIEETH